MNPFYVADALQRHLIRSLCSDLCDTIIRELDSSASAKTGQLSIEVRQTKHTKKYTFLFFVFKERNKIIQKMSERNRNQLSKVNESLNGKVKFILEMNKIRILI